VIEEVYPSHFTMGGPIGLPVGSRAYAVHTYRIYIPDPENRSTERDEQLYQLLHRTNFGGNVWEVWFDKGPIVSIDPTVPQTYQLSKSDHDHGLSSGIRNYSVL